MYCRVVITSPDLSFEMERKQRSKGAFVAPMILYSIMTVYIMRVYAYNDVSKIEFVRSFSSLRYSKIITNITSRKVSQICTKDCKTRSFICKVYPNFLRSSRHCNCDAIFVVIVFFFNESVHGFNNSL